MSHENNPFDPSDPSGGFPPANEAPVLVVPLHDGMTWEDGPMAYSAPLSAFYDPEGGQLTYSASLMGGAPLPPWLQFDALSMQFFGTAQNQDVGTYWIQVTATDDHGASTSDDFQLAVMNVNDAPLLVNPVPDQVVTSGQYFWQPLPMPIFQDEDVGDWLTYSIFSPTGATTWLQFDPYTGTISGTPSSWDVGTHHIDVHVMDSSGAMAMDTFYLTVQGGNTPPVGGGWVPLPQAFEDAPYLIRASDLTVGFMDPEGAPLTVQWLTVSNGFVTDNGDQTWTYQPPPDFNGPVQISYHVSDGTFSVPGWTTLDVAPVNDAPVAVGMVPDQFAAAGVPVLIPSYLGLFSDVDGWNLSLSASLQNGDPLPSWLMFDPWTAAFTGSPPVDAEGTTLLLRITATDPFLATATQDFRLQITEAPPPPPISGTAGNDILNGTALDDVIYGYDGMDQLYGLDGNDLLDGGNGSDQLYGGAGNDTLVSGDGGGRLDGGDGDDRLEGGSSYEVMYGGAGNDTLLAGDGSGGDALMGDDGNDTLTGSAGDDQLNGGAGDDVLRGGAGADYLADTGGSNVIEGGDGNDTFYVGDWGGPANNVLDGGAGDDRFEVYASHAGSTLTLSGGEGRDTFLVYDGNQSPLVFTDFEGGSAGDILNVQNLLFASSGYAGGNPFDAATGYLRLVDDGVKTELQWNRTGEAVNGAWNTVAILQGTAASTLTIDNFLPGAAPDGSLQGQTITGTEWNDTLVGSVGNDFIYGLDGSDTMSGYSGDDVMEGGWGYDYLYGDQGNDTLRSGDGGGHLSGGDGDDRLEGGSGTDALWGDAGNDILIASDGGAFPGADMLYGGDGNDLLTGGMSQDSLDGGAGDDVLRGGWGQDYLFDAGGNDLLQGEDGDDVLMVADYQGTSNSVLDGGAGNDQFMVSFHQAGSTATVTGGWGQDRFDLDAFGAPSITDFEAGIGGDRLNVETLLLRSTGYAGGNPFDPSLGFLRLLATEAGTELQWDSTGAAGGGTWQTVARLQGTLATQLTVDNFLPAGVVTSLHIAVNNAPPVGAPAAMLPTVGEDQSVVLTEAMLLDGFTDPEGGTLSVQALSADHGTLAPQPDGSWVYTPDANFHGTVTFSYQVSDGNQAVAATQTLQVQPTNDAPQGSPAAGLTVPEDALVSISSAELLLGFGDVDGDTLSVTQLQVSQGALVDNRDGTWNYQPPANHAGEVRFTYAVSDGLASTPAELVVQVTPTPDAPVVVAEPADQVLLAGSTVQFTVAGSFQDADAGDTLQFSATAADGSALPAWLAFDAATATFSGTVPAGAAGTSLEVRVVATDSTQLSTTDVFTLYLEPAGPSEADDVLNGTAGNDTIDGLGGNDVISGLSGDDRLVGGTGHDQIDGGAGADVIEGGEGWDLVSGGSGFDTFIVRRLDSGVDRIGDYTAGERIVFDNNGVATTAAEYTLTIDGGDTVLRYGEHPLGADVEVRLAGVHTGNVVVQQQWIDGRWQEVVFIAPGTLGTGTAGPDVLYGSVDADVLAGLGGSDILHGYGGDDLLDGGEGYDQLYGGQGNDTLISGSGGGYMEGGQGDDLLQGGDGWEEMLGGEGNDTLLSMEGGGYLYGQGGDDLLQGGSGVEYMSGGSGNDTLIAGAGGGSLSGEEGNDTLVGGDGSDTFSEYSGTNVMEGRAGADHFHVWDDGWSTANNSVIDAGAGNDRFMVRLNNAASTVTITGGEGSDVYMLDPNSTVAPVITDFAAGAGGDLLHIEQLLNASWGYTGGNPFDPALGYLRLVTDGGDTQLQWNSGAAGVGSWKTVATLQGTTGTALTLHNFSPAAPPDGSANGLDLVGTPDSDVLQGSVVSDTISGLGGSDILHGYGGDDLLDGGEGYDQLYGGQGNDTLISGSGGGYMEGGQGDDLLQGGDGWEEMLGGEGNDTLLSMEGGGYLYGQGGDDLLQGGSGVEYMSGGSGNDTLIAGAGGGSLSGEEGNDTLVGGDGSDTFSEYSGTNVMEGRAGADHFHVWDDGWSTANNSVIDAGAGNDRFMVRLNNAASTVTITGGEGSDVYMLDPNSTVAPVITDFAAGADGDLLHIEQLLNASAGYTSGNPFDPALGYLRLAANGPHTLLQWDNSGSGDGSSWKTVAELRGTYAFDLTPQNFAPSTAVTNIEVVVVNAPPALATPLEDQVANEGSAFLFTIPEGTFLDPDMGDTLGYAATLADGSALPAWLTFDAATRTFSGTPPTDAASAIEIRITATDAGGLSAADVITLTVQEVDEGPVGSPTASLPPAAEDESYVLSAASLLEGFTDGDGQALTVEALTASHGSLAQQPDGDWLYTPDPDFNGTVTFTYQVTDGTHSVGATQSLEVLAVNDDPEGAAAGSLPAAADEDTPYLVTTEALLAGFTDADGDTLQVAGLSSDQGTLVDNLDGTWTFQADPDASGPVTFQFDVEDGQGGAFSATRTLDVLPVNDAPELAVPLWDQSGQERVAFEFAVPPDTFVDVDGETLAYDAMLADGTALPDWLTFDAATATFTGTPPVGTAGDISVEVVATDAGGAQARASFVLTIEPRGNDAPEGDATGLLATGDEDTSVLIHASDLLEGFADPDGDPLSVVNLVASNGTLTDLGDGTWRFDPDEDFAGPIALEYDVADPLGAIVSTTQSFVLRAAADAPVVDVANAGGDEDSVIAISLSAALQDLDGSEELTVWLHALPDGVVLSDGTNSFTADAASGSVDITGWDWSSLVVTPAAHTSGNFTLQVEAIAAEVDGTETSVGESHVFADILVEVAAVADAPNVTAADAAGDEDTPITLDIAAALVDLDGSESLAVEIRGIPHGATLRTAAGDLVPVDGGVALFTAAQVADGVLEGLTFSAAPNANGTYSLEVTATSTEASGSSASSSAVFTIDVQAVNDAPTLTRPLEDQRADTGSDFSYTIAADTFTDVDVAEGDVLTLTASLADGSDLPAWLTFDAATATFSGTPGPQDNGELHIRLTATDGAGASVSDDFVVTLNTPPTAGDDAAIVLRATPTVLDVLANDADGDGDALVVQEVGAAANGTTSIDAQGRIVYTGNAGYVGYDSFEYTVSDGRGGTAIATVNVEVASHVGTAGNDTISGSNAGDWILGLAGADTIDGLLGNDAIQAGAGDDTVTGGGGADTLYGGEGDDTFLVRGTDWTGDIVEGGDGIDTVRFTGAVTLGVAGVLLAGVEVLDMAGQRLTVQGSQWLDLADLTVLNAAAITGDSAANAISGSASADNISGAAGDDVLEGRGGDDLLAGGAGADQLAGGEGNDVFLAAGTELAGDSIDGGEGVDTLRLGGATTVSAATLSLSGVELLDLGGYTLTVQGSAALDLGALQLAGTGTIAGDLNANEIIGTQGSDTIVGNAGNDLLDGALGDDTLSGGAGADMLVGGEGADTFRAGSTELGGDMLDGGDGIDTLLFTSAVSLTSGFSATSVEVLDMAGQALNVGTTDAVDLSSFDVLRAGAINGDARANTIIGTTGADTINGGSGNDVLDGSAGNDSLAGGAGADQLSGGDGDDVFRAGATELTGDVVDGGVGVDTLLLTANTSVGAAGVSFSGVEVLDMGGRSLTVQGATALDLSELDLANAGQILGDAAGNAIAGTRGNDSIDGGSGNDNLAGAAGDDVLRGGTGADVLRGGAGNDTLYGSRNARGDGFADTYVFDEALDPASNVDAVIGIDAGGLDRLALDPALFQALTGGASAGVDAGEFRASAGGNAADANDFILFDTATGNLFYDADGSGAGQKVLFARLSGITGTLDATDFTTQLPPQV